MVIDCFDDDWDWFDPAGAITIDQLASEQGWPLPAPDDLDVTIRMAWSPGPDNMRYVFIHVHDDTLDIESSDLSTPWYDDMVQLAFDPLDHGRTPSRDYAQGFVIKAETFVRPPVLMYPAGYSSHPQAWQAFALPPYGQASVRTDPPAAGTAAFGGDVPRSQRVPRFRDRGCGGDETRREQAGCPAKEFRVPASQPCPSREHASRRAGDDWLQRRDGPGVLLPKAEPVYAARGPDRLGNADLAAGSGMVVPALVMSAEPLVELMQLVDAAEKVGDEELGDVQTTVFELTRGMGLLGSGYVPELLKEDLVQVRLWIGKSYLLVHQVAFELDLARMSEGLPEAMRASMAGMKIAITERHTAIETDPAFPEDSFTFVLPEGATLVERFDPLERVEGTEPEGFSDGQIPFEVGALDDAVVELLVSAEPAQQEVLMAPQHSGDVVHGFDLASHLAAAPAVWELLGPGPVGVHPEALEVLLQQVGSDSPQIHRQQLGQLHALGVGEVLGALEEAPPVLGQHGVQALLFEPARLLSTDLVEGLAKLHFIHAEGGDLVQAAMGQTVVDHVLGRAADLIPVAPEGARYLHP
jgi:hypothetical protein